MPDLRPDGRQGGSAARLSAALVRRRSRALLALQKPPEPVGRVWDVVVPSGRPGGVPVRMFRSRDATVAAAVVLLHGGGWVGGDLETHDRVARRLANRLGGLVALVDYRRAPEDPYPAALDDAVAVTEWLLRDGGSVGVDPRRVVVMGDSAGGNLAAATCLRMLHAGCPLPAGQVLLYPILAPSAADDPGDGGYPDRTTLEWYWRQYLAAAPFEAYAAPMLAGDLAGLPPAVVYVGELDPVRADGRRYAARLREAAVPTAIRTYPAPHAFIMMDAVEPSADALLDDLPGDLAAVLGRPWPA